MAPAQSCFCNRCGRLDTKKRSDILNLNCSSDTGCIKAHRERFTDGVCRVSGRHGFAESVVICTLVILLFRAQGFLTTTTGGTLGAFIANDVSSPLK